MTEEFIRALGEKAGKVIHEREGAYTLAVTEVRGIRVLFCFKEGYTGYYYAKIVLEGDLSALSCREAEYSPAGLYAFSENPRELAEKAYEKAILLASRSTTTTTDP